LGKSVNNKKYYQEIEQDNDDWNTDRQENRRKNNEKRIRRALKTKNIEELMGIDEEEDYV